MWILFEEQLPETGARIIIKESDKTEYDIVWHSIMYSAIDWNKRPYPVAWKLKE